MAEEPHRKIELDSPEDLRYLISRQEELARSKLDQHLPRSASNPSDPLRAAVEEMIIDYVHRTFTLALPSISINGLDAAPTLHQYLPSAAPPTEEYEPYDRQLHREWERTYGEMEKQTLMLARMRREQPAKMAEMYAEAIARELEADERRLLDIEKQVEDQSVGLGGVEVKELERATRVYETRSRAVKELKEVGENLPKAAAKLKRAGEAANFALEKSRKKN